MGHSAITENGQTHSFLHTQTLVHWQAFSSGVKATLILALNSCLTLPMVLKLVVDQATTLTGCRRLERFAITK